MASTSDVVEGCDRRGMCANLASTNLRIMQLIQIGETKQKTVLELVQEMAARQLAEIEQLKVNALSRSRNRRVGRARLRCSSVKHSS
jgi:ABC-type transport system involved in cytochrome c biogenesis ATPase subunit